MLNIGGWFGVFMCVLVGVGGGGGGGMGGLKQIDTLAADFMNVCVSYFLMLKHLVIIAVEELILLYLVFIKNKYTHDSILFANFFVGKTFTRLVED